MSDFAPFVAAVLRDKAIYDLMEENEKLREENETLRELSMSVEVTGPERWPIYARGRLDKDIKCSQWNSHRWGVALSSEPELHPPCPLSALGFIEIWIGGSIRASITGFSRDCEVQILDDDFDDSENDDDGDGDGGGDDMIQKDNKPDEKKEKILLFCFEPGEVILCVKLGWTEKDLHAQNLHFPNDAEDMMDFCITLAHLCPDKLCTFTMVSPNAKYIRTLMECPLPPGAGAKIPEVLARNAC